MPFDIILDMRGYEMHGHDIDPLQRTGHTLHGDEVAVLKPRQEHVEKTKPDDKYKIDRYVDQMQAPPVLLDGTPGFQPLQKRHPTLPPPLFRRYPGGAVKADAMPPVHSLARRPLPRWLQSG